MPFNGDHGSGIRDRVSERVRGSVLHRAQRHAKLVRPVRGAAEVCDRAAQISAAGLIKLTTRRERRPPGTERFKLTTKALRVLPAAKAANHVTSPRRSASRRALRRADTTPRPRHKPTLRAKPTSRRVCASTPTEAPPRTGLHHQRHIQHDVRAGDTTQLTLGRNTSDTSPTSTSGSWRPLPVQRRQAIALQPSGGAGRRTLSLPCGRSRRMAMANTCPSDQP